VVIKENNLSSHVLNKTAAFIWEMCDGSLDADEIADRVHQHFDVPLEEARTDTRSLIDSLTRAGIMNTVKGTRNRKR
jgi:hypothetical protein